MARNPGSHPNTYTRPMVELWGGLLRRAQDAKREFNVRGDQIEQFYSAASGFMWHGNYLERFMGGSGGLTPPKFKVSLNKASEYINIMAPMLFWQMANRKVRPYRSMNLDPMALAGQDPLMQQFMTQLADQQATEDARNTMRAAVLEHVLNYLPREQPYGGLGAATHRAVFDSLLRGCGFLSTESYRYPESDRTLVGSFYTDVADVLVDPDCRDTLWAKANWVAIRHQNKFFEVEQHFGLRPGSLRDYGTKSSFGAAWGAGRSDLPQSKQEDTQKDMLEWYEIFSRAGTGNKLGGTRRIIEPEFDAAVGDYAYMCVCKNCPYPLNLPSEELLGQNATDEWIRDQLRWPTEYWRDNQWPVSKLDYYPHSGNSPWSEPPLASSIGELTILNILISAYVQTAYDNRQQIVGVVKGAIEDLQSLVQSSKSPLVVELEPQLDRSVNDVMQFMTRPEVNGDIPKTIEFLLGLVEKRTGLSDMLYGGNSGANPRSATEFTGKMDTVNIRPEFMQKRVAEWQSEVAGKEAFCLYSHVHASDIAEQLGPLGRPAWEMLVTNEEPESFLRSSQCYIEASEISRPNKSHDAQMLQGMQQYLIPVLAGEFAQSRNSDPLNGFIKAMGDSMDIDVTGFLLPPPPDPEDQAQQMQQQMQQAQVQAELQKTQAEAAKLQAEAQNLTMSGQNSQQELAIKAQESQGKIQLAQTLAQIKQQQAEHGMSLKGQDTQMKLMTMAQAAKLKEQESNAKMEALMQQAKLKAVEADHKLESQTSMAEIQAIMKKQQMSHAEDTHAQQSQQRQTKAQQELMIELMKAHQKATQSGQSHAQQIVQADDKAEQQAEHANIFVAQKMLMAAAMNAQAKDRKQHEQGKVKQ